MSADAAAATPDAGAILDNVVGLIGADVTRIGAIVSLTERTLTGEEARILSGYARALVDVARARKAAAGDGELTPEEVALMDKLQAMPAVQELMRRGEGR